MADEGKKAVEDYFGAGSSSDKAQLDRAALIVALVAGRESATRTDYAHPRIKDIVRVLDEAAARAGAGAGTAHRR
jgi:hypothetical protein